MLRKPKWIKPSSVKTYDDAIRYLRMIEEGKRRAEKSTYEAILTQVFQKYIRLQGDCVLRNIPKGWTCNGDITAGHVISRSVKEFKWSVKNCYPQCKSCNQMHQYYPFVFEDWAKQKLGQEFEEMKEKVKRHEYFDLPQDEIISQIQKWLTLINTETNG